MKNLKHLKSKYLILFLSISLVCSCQPKESDGTKSALENNTPAENRNLSDEFKEYWYSGKAEISSYELTQYRYGEPRKGKAVLIFVSEDFNPKLQVKADNPTEESVSVLKLNKTKDFATGIYPYHIMESTFSPLGEKSHAMKITASVHEWCGQAFMQINNREKLDVKIHTYFESTADQELQLDEALMENEVWNLLRINPESDLLDVDKMIPSLEYLRLRHRDAKAYPVDIAQKSVKDTMTTTFDYTTLNRTLKIKQKAEFPYEILGWEESITENRETKTTSAKRLESLRSAYWNQNKPEFSRLRDSLQLPQYGK